MEFRQEIRDRASQRILFLPHAVRQMSRPDRMISTADVRKVIEEGEVIEDYPEDARGHSCLILGKGRDGGADTYRMYTEGRILGGNNRVYSG